MQTCFSGRMARESSRDTYFRNLNPKVGPRGRALKSGGKSGQILGQVHLFSKEPCRPCLELSSVPPPPSLVSLLPLPLSYSFLLTCSLHPSPSPSLSLPPAPSLVLVLTYLSATFTTLVRGGGLGSRPKKMYGERLGDGVEYHLMKPTPRR